MQGLKPSSQPSGPFRAENSDTYSDGTPRYRNNGAFNPQSYTGAPLSRNNSSGHASDSGAATEAALRAQLIDLRRELSRSEQAVEDSKHDLRLRQDLLKSAAGEARREVLALRQHRDASERALSETRHRIQQLEREVTETRAQLETATDALARSTSEASFEEWGEGEPGVGHQSLQARLDAAERQLEEARADQRVSAASKEALSAQVGELVSRLQSLKSELSAGQKEREKLQADAAEVARLCERQRGLIADLQSRLDEAVQQREQAISRAEALENELSVVREEATQDRLAGAARQLELGQLCSGLEASKLEDDAGGEPQGNQVTELEGRLRLTEAELAAVTNERDRLQERLAAWPLRETDADLRQAVSPFSGSTNSPAQTLEGLRLVLSPAATLKGVHSPERLACRRVLQLPIDCEFPLADLSKLQERADGGAGGPAVATAGGAGGSAVATAGRQPAGESSSTPQLAAELAAAAGFLRRLNARLAEQGTSSGLPSAGSQDSGIIGEEGEPDAAVDEFQAAVGALQQTLTDTTQPRHKQTVSIHADGTKGAQSDAPNGVETQGRPRLLQSLLGGVFIVPALAVAAVLLPSRS